MLKQMKKTFCILLTVLFVVSFTAVAVSANPVMVKEQNMDMNKMYMNKMDMNKMGMNKMDMNKMDMNKKGMGSETDED